MPLMLFSKALLAGYVRRGVGGTEMLWTAAKLGKLLYPLGR